MRRGRVSRGFSLAEALVAIGVTSLTILLLSSAVWGLRMANAPRDAVQATPVDWMAARRALQSWSAGVSMLRDAEGRFEGSASRARMLVKPFAAGLGVGFVADLRVNISDGVYTLSAHRHPGLKDIRLVDGDGQRSTILTSTTPIRLLYLMPRGQEMVWRYDVDGRSGFPAAVGVELDSERVLTAPLLASISAACVAALGRPGLEATQCEIR